MPATPPYIPPRDGEFATWLANFESLVAVNFAAYGLTAGQAADVTTVNTAYQSAYTTSQDPNTRTPASVAAKDTARTNAEVVVRPIAQEVKANPAVDDATRIALGLTVDKFPPTPIPVPTTFPLLDILAVTPGQMKVQWRDSETPTSKAKPFGAAQAHVWVALGVAPAMDPSGAAFYGPFTKSPFFLDFDPADNGKVATIFARWVTQTGEIGPWSVGEAMTVSS